MTFLLLLLVLNNNLSPSTELDNLALLRCHQVEEEWGHTYKGKLVIKDYLGGWQRIGEVLGRTNTFSPEEVVGAWMGSLPHKQILIRPTYTHIGEAICSQPGTYHYVVVYGERG